MAAFIGSQGTWKCLLSSEIHVSDDSAMKSAVVRRFGGPDVIEIDELPMPDVGPEHVRIKVLASCVNPIDLSARAGRLTEAGLMAPQPAVGLGWDVSGVVDSVGAWVTRFQVGQRVIGLRDLLFAGGAHAEHVVLHESSVAPAPASVNAEQAATLPLNALTADRALALTGLGRGDTLLVTGIRTLAHVRAGAAHAARSPVRRSRHRLAWSRQCRA